MDGFESGRSGVVVWWLLLCALGVFNIVVWLRASVWLLRRYPKGSTARHARFPHLVLSAVYSLGCAFRSFYPRADVQRLVVVDSWLSSVAVGRSVATLAELCFAAQLALLLAELAGRQRSAFGTLALRSVLPLIVVAELWSWYAVLTTNYLGNAMEQSTWTAVGALVTASLALHVRAAKGRLRAFLAGLIALGAGFVGFMCIVDVPMYFARWRVDEYRGRAYLSVLEGLRDATLHWVVSHRWQDWQQEIAWMSLYFSVAVWISIALMHAPLPAPLGRRVRPPQAPECDAAQEAGARAQ